MLGVKTEHSLVDLNWVNAVHLLSSISIYVKNCLIPRNGFVLFLWAPMNFNTPPFYFGILVYTRCCNGSKVVLSHRLEI